MTFRKQSRAFENEYSMTKSDDRDLFVQRNLTISIKYRATR
jgi:hypothetical protein